MGPSAGRRSRGSAIRCRVAGVVLALVLAGCGGKKSAPTEPSSPAAAQPPAPTKVVDPATVGTITGTVTLEGTPPAPHEIMLSGSPTCAKLHSSPLIYPEVVTGNHGALADVIVYVKSGLENYRFVAPAAPARIDQRGCMYEPHIQGLMVGQKLGVTNTDPVLHNVLLLPRQNLPWNKSQPIGSSAIQTSFDRPELAVKVLCNIHPWMCAYVFAFSHPYFDVTSKKGTFELKNLPPGTYTIEAWQEKYGTQDQSVTLSAKEGKSISFAFKATHN
jgi:plastocyanin